MNFYFDTSSLIKLYHQESTTDYIQQLMKYGNIGLRKLDAIQLASALIVYEHVDLYCTSDKLLKEIILSENLP